MVRRPAARVMRRLLDAQRNARDASAMRAVVQRVKQARVTVGAEVVGAIGVGLLVLVGVVGDDTVDDARWLERKLLSLRIFPDTTGRMQRSVLEVGGRLLLVSQFTLCADTAKGARPSFTLAMSPERAAVLLDDLVASLRRGIEVEAGRFGADMVVELTNEGPVTLWLDSKAPR